MPLEIIQYPHPTLRHVSRPLKKIDADLRDLVAEMFRLMYKHNGVGLAANQVDLPYRLFVMNMKADPKTGEEIVFVNPVISRRKGMDEAEEGCLSLPGLYSQVKRPSHVVIDAYSLEGKPLHYEADGLFARIVQHETDHLDGRLFIDRLSTTGELEVRPGIEEFEIAFGSRRERGEVPSNDVLAARRAELEKLRT
ncbi:MAG: peptide deformylase [Planctomycetota bacterium]|nr:peptide deformylase [Planctomycetota bacterium]